MDFSYAHESNPNNPLLERTMDIYNNLQGIGLGGQGLSNTAIMFQVYDLVKTGGLYMIENGSLVKTHFS
jgi:hypothetical protein